MNYPFKGIYKITQGFGENPQDYVKFNLKGHAGIDYGLPLETPVISPFSGKVIEAQFDPYYGNYIKVENAQEGSVLAHLSRLDVVPEQIVFEGQALGLSGSTGNSTGPHLHWAYYRIPRNRQNGYYGFIDQTPFIPVIQEVAHIPENPNWKDLPEYVWQLEVDRKDLMRQVGVKDEMLSAQQETINTLKKQLEEQNKDQSDQIKEDTQTINKQKSVIAGIVDFVKQLSKASETKEDGTIWTLRFLGLKDQEGGET